MRFNLSRRGLFVVLRFGDANRDAIGFVVKPRSAMIFSERYGKWRRHFTLGPLYFRTYARSEAAAVGGR